MKEDKGNLIGCDPEILGGTPVFKGTRVPVKTLVEYLEDNYTLAEFIECFPMFTLEAPKGVLETFKTGRDFQSRMKRRPDGGVA